MQATASGLTASIDAARPTLELPLRGKLYVIETQWWHQVGLVRTLTANHLLTLTPQSGDKIVADLDWHVGAYEDGTIEVAVYRSSYETQLGSSTSDARVTSSPSWPRSDAKGVPDGRAVPQHGPRPVQPPARRTGRVPADCAVTGGAGDEGEPVARRPACATVLPGRRGARRSAARPRPRRDRP